MPKISSCAKLVFLDQFVKERFKVFVEVGQQLAAHDNGVTVSHIQLGDVFVVVVFEYKRERSKDGTPL